MKNLPRTEWNGQIPAVKFYKRIFRLLIKFKKKEKFTDKFRREIILFVAK